MKTPVLVAITIIMFGTSFQTVFSQPVFVGEYIDFSLSKTAFKVSALYRIANADARAARYSISYPFPDKIGEIFSLTVSVAGSEGSITYEKEERGIVFPLDMKGGETADVLISYRQRAKKDNVYILTSTQKWGKPLRFAEYTLVADRGVSVTGFSYPPDSSRSDSTSELYYWSKTDFMPDREFVISAEGIDGSE
jgi:hypothetical protein